MKTTLRNPLVIAALVTIAVVTAIAAWWMREAPPAGPAGEPQQQLRNINADQAGELLAIFDKLNYAWPPGGPLPPVALESLPGDINELRVQEKKSLFFRSLAPLIAAENSALRRQREFLTRAFSDKEMLADEEIRQRIRKIAIHYKVAGEPEDPRFQRKLLSRVDIIPAGLILAQAANESAWGTSRFAREANNLFGIWTWNKDKGMEPLRRDPDATHFVRIYSDLRAAVNNYLYTINVGGAYEGLRQKRAALREAGKAPDPITLAGGLSRYSERGEAYVEEIRSMIRYNKLDAIDRLELRDGGGQAAP